MDTQENLMKKLVEMAEKDPSFRESLIGNPTTALKEALDIEVPDDFNVVVHEDDTQTVHLVLPASAELTDTQLQTAAGGGGMGICPAGFAAWGEKEPA